VALGAEMLGELYLHQLLCQHAHTLTQEIRLFHTRLAQHPVSATLYSSAIGVGSSHRVLNNRDENHPMAVRVNSLWIICTLLGTLPQEGARGEGRSR
jgi:hypothetical protein